MSDQHPTGDRPPEYPPPGHQPPPPSGEPQQPQGPPSYGQPPPPPPGPPSYGQPPYGQQPPAPPYGQQPPAPPYGQPPYGQPPYGQPPYGSAPYAQPAYGQQPYGPPGAGGPADLGPRFLARLLDFLLLGVVSGLLTAIVLAVVLAASDGTVGWGMGTVGQVFSALLALAYFSLMESSQGRTVGKIALGLEVRGASGGRPTLAEALRRNAWTALGVLAIIPVVGDLIGGLASLAIVLVILVTISNDPVRRQGWHDKLAGGTTVVRTR